MGTIPYAWAGVDSNGNPAAGSGTVTTTTGNEPPPTRVIDWSDPAPVWVANGIADLTQFGARTTNNVETTPGLLRVHVRPSGTQRTIGGVTFAPTDYLAGMAQIRQSFKYGTVKFRARFTAGYGGRLVILTWPDTAAGSPSWGSGGGEIDMIEYNGNEDAARQAYTLALHYGNGTQQVTKRVTNDGTVWRDYRLDWGPSLVRFWIDGAVVFTDSTHSPPGPMKLSFQTAVAGGGQSPTWNGSPRVASFLEVGPVSIWEGSPLP